MSNKDKILLIGCGFFSQNIYIPIIKKLFKEKNIFFFDERVKLKKKTALKYNCRYIEKLNRNILKKEKITHCILCFDRNRSYYYCKFILNCGINLFAEKPICSSSQNLNKLLLIAKREKISFASSFQRTHDRKIIFLKEKIRNIKSKLIEINCNFYSGNFRHNKKTIIRTLEKIKNLKKLKNVNKISFLIFLNRYWHIINSINFIYPFADSQKKIKKLSFSILNQTSFLLAFKFEEKKFNLVMNSEKKKGWYEKYNIKTKKKNYSISLNAPMKFNAVEIEKTTFFSQIKFFLKKKRKFEYTNIENCIYELKFIEKIWKKRFLR